MTDPLVMSLCRAIVADCESDDNERTDDGVSVATAKAYDSAADCLSAVLAAARALTAAIRDDDSEPSSAVEWRTEQLERALAAADGAR